MKLANKAAGAASLVSSLAVVGLAASPAFAWSYGLTGNGVCQPDGSYKVTWTVDNTTENEPLHITESSNSSVVQPGTDVAANSTKDYSQTVDGTKAGSYTLSLKGNWNGDPTPQAHSATVNLDQPCTQPTGGRGGSNPITPSASTTQQPVAAPKAVVPAGPVNAGQGSKTLSLAGLGGLVVSLAAVAVGLIRRVQNV